MKRVIILGVLALWLASSACRPSLWMMPGWLFCMTARAWDGDWTDAKSGMDRPFANPGSTDGQAGTDPPQKYYTAAPRDYAEVDPEELDDYFNRHNRDYTPYALARITQDLHYNGRVVPKGYYLIKPGDPDDGSPLVNLRTMNGASAVASPMASTADEPILAPAGSTVASPGEPPMAGNIPKTDKEKPKKPVYAVFVIKRQGKVVMVVPINRRQLYVPARKDKIPARALAWVEEEDRHPVLKFYYQHCIYSTDFQ